MTFERRPEVIKFKVGGQINCGNSENFEFLFSLTSFIVFGDNVCDKSWIPPFAHTMYDLKVVVWVI